MKEVEPRRQEDEPEVQKATPGEALQLIRRRRSLTQENLAQILGVSPSYVSKIERGERRFFSSDRVLRLVEGLDLDPEEISILLDTEAIDKKTHEAIASPTARLLDEFLKNKTTPSRLRVEVDQIVRSVLNLVEEKIEQIGVYPPEQTSRIVDNARLHFLKVVEEGNPIYPYLPRHVIEVEKWAKRLLQNHPEVDGEVVLLSVWLHDIGWAIGEDDVDHAIKSETETTRFLAEKGIAPETVARVAHCVRAHRNKDVQPETLEARIVAAADSASHFTDINYIVHCADGIKDYALGKLERDYRDVGLLPGLQEKLTPLYLAWKQLLTVFPG